MVEALELEIGKIKEYAKKFKVPIMQDEGINFLTDFIRKNQIKNILEVGTAIGYSAIMMALVNNEVKITTIERDENRYLEALKNIKRLGLEKRITLIFKDANDTYLDEKFDLVFLDAAKGQNIRFFQNFERNLVNGGYIITDNMNFHGLVFKDPQEITSKNLRSLVKKIKEYRAFLEENPLYVTQIYSLGDGIAVSNRKKVGVSDV